MAPLLAVCGLGITLLTQQGLLTVVDDVSFDIAPGETIGLAGESGSGKTMTALAILGLLPRRARVSGRIHFAGSDLADASAGELRAIRGKRIGVVFQEAMTSLHPAITIGRQISEVIRAHEDVSRAAAHARAVELLGRVGIPDPRQRADQYPHQFSGGMQQRAMLAMALSCGPELLIADEPTTALDVTIQMQIVELIKSLQAELGLAVLFVSHDLGLLSGLCSRVVVMYAGQVAEIAPTRALFTAAEHPYTAALLSAAPHPDFKGSRLPTIPGAPPLAGEFPAGCRFSERCTFVQERCRHQAIPLEIAGTERVVRCIRHNEIDLAPVVLAGRTGVDSRTDP